MKWSDEGEEHAMPDDWVPYVVGKLFAAGIGVGLVRLGLKGFSDRGIVLTSKKMIKGRGGKLVTPRA